MWAKRAEGARIRAKLDWYEKGEKSTKYFYNLEKTRSRNKLWNQIKDDQGKIKTGVDSILDVQTKFYSKLLKSEGWDEHSAHQLLSNITKRLTEKQKVECDQTITEKEIENAIHALKLDKSLAYLLSKSEDLELQEL